MHQGSNQPIQGRDRLSKQSPLIINKLFSFQKRLISLFIEKLLLRRVWLHNDHQNKSILKGGAMMIVMIMVVVVKMMTKMTMMTKIKIKEGPPLNRGTPFEEVMKKYWSEGVPELLILCAKFINLVKIKTIKKLFILCANVYELGQNLLCNL